MYGYLFIKANSVYFGADADCIFSKRYVSLLVDKQWMLPELSSQLPNKLGYVNNVTYTVCDNKHISTRE